MKNILFNIVITILILFIFTGFSNPTEGYTLFKIGRTKDSNEIYYTINLDKKGNLDSENPITVYWLKKNNGNKVEPLTWIQKKYAYGLHIIEKSDESAKFQFVSYHKRTFELKKNKEGNFRVYTISEDRLVEVNKIYIHLDGGSFWFPVISKVDLLSKDPVTNKSVVEEIIP